MHCSQSEKGNGKDVTLLLSGNRKVLGAERTMWKCELREARAIC